jgi:hypothetical protein
VPVDDFPKQAFPIPGSDGDEIRPGPGIIVPRQPDRTAMFFPRFIFHHNPVPTPLLVSPDRRRGESCIRPDPCDRPKSHIRPCDCPVNHPIHNQPNISTIENPSPAINQNDVVSPLTPAPSRRVAVHQPATAHARHTAFSAHYSGLTGRCQVYRKAGAPIIIGTAADKIELSLSFTSNHY